MLSFMMFDLSKDSNQNEKQLDFNEHVHSEDSMPRGKHIHFQKANMSFPKKIPTKEMTKTRSN